MSASNMDMSDASMGEGDEGDPMMQSPRSNDGTAASGPNVAALGEALEPPIEITDLKVCFCFTFQSMHCFCNLVLMSPGNRRPF